MIYIAGAEYYNNRHLHADEFETLTCSVLEAGRLSSSNLELKGWKSFGEVANLSPLLELDEPRNNE